MLEIHCPDHFEKIRKFATENKLAEQLQDRLDYLAEYGNTGLEAGDPNRKNVKCALFFDSAPHSFVFDVYWQKGDEWKFVMNGGLIFQSPEIPADGSAPSFTVSMNSRETGWFIHT